MPANARKEIVDPNEVGLYFCTSCCVRRAFLCGDAEYTGKNYDHRKRSMEEMLKYMAQDFALDIVSHSIMSNHFHLILRIGPDLVKTWSDEKVAEHWLRLYPKDRDKQGKPCQPKPEAILALANDKQRVAELRKRLCSISWFHAYLKEKIARQSNAEDDVTGAFWEGRFKCVRLIDMSAAVAACVYVDLNMIRAQLAETPETSLHTSVWYRIRARQARKQRSQSSIESRDDVSLSDADADCWLAPISVGPLPQDQRHAERGLRASDDPRLPMTPDQYLQLVDWTGRELRSDKRGAIAADLADILQRLDVESSQWLEGMEHFGQWFRRAAGNAGRLMQQAQQAGRRWFQGLSRCRQLFTSTD